MGERMTLKTRFPLHLSGNQLKIIAMIAMTADHVGLQLLPELTFLRWIGRLALPLYAYMIAEGCRHTRSRKRYLLSIALMALVCQAVYLVAMGSLYQCILVTFFLSLCLIYLLDYAREAPGIGRWCLFGLGVITAWFLCQVLPTLLPGTDFRIDYDFWGIALPLLIYLGKTRPQSLLLAAVGLVGLALDHGGRQWLGLLALPLLMLYDGTRGKRNIKYLFYFYYPAHLVVIYILSMIL